MIAEGMKLNIKPASRWSTRKVRAHANSSAGLCACGNDRAADRTQCTECLDRASRLRRRVAKAVDEAKDRPCIDCGCQYPSEVMEFDHVRGKRKFSLGAATRFSLTAVLAEIAKCDVRCPLCHRLRHYNDDHGTNFRAQTMPASAVA